MAANTSQRRAQSIVFGSKVSAFATWFLIAGCGPCGPRAIPVRTLPQDLTFSLLLIRMRCHVCSGRLETASLDNAEKGQRRRVLRI